MRSGKEVRQAIAMLGGSFVGRVWEGMDQESGRAWAMFQALGWVVGAEDTDLTLILEYVGLKMQQYAENELEKKYAR